MWREIEILYSKFGGKLWNLSKAMGFVSTTAFKNPDSVAAASCEPSWASTTDHDGLWPMGICACSYDSPKYMQLSFPCYCELVIATMTMRNPLHVHVHEHDNDVFLSCLAWWRSAVLKMTVGNCNPACDLRFSKIGGSVTTVTTHQHMLQLAAVTTILFITC
jgi:hypothetical protein